MIPLDFLKIQRRGRVVRPLYLTNPAPAGLVLELAKSSRTVGEFRKAVESAGGDRKLLSGLAHIVERLSHVEEVDVKQVARVRVEVFKTSAEVGLALTPEARERIFHAAAERLKMGVEEVKRVFYKAYEDNRVIVQPPSVTPSELMEIYNLSLLQALLFKSLYVDLWLPNVATVVKSVVRAAKGHRLMYIAEERDGGLWIHFEGPASIFRQTERYGVKLAKLVPYITAAGVWRIEAEVKLNQRKYRLDESHEKAPPLPKRTPEVGEFDSTVEWEFYRQVSRVCSVEREPEALVVERRVYIPDFKIGDLYIEIVGFWTPDYLRRKYEKLSKANRPLLILVDEELAAATWGELMPNVVLYRGRPKLSDVYKYIKPHCRQ